MVNLVDLRNLVFTLFCETFLEIFSFIKIGNYLVEVCLKIHPFVRFYTKVCSRLKKTFSFDFDSNHGILSRLISNSCKPMQICNKK